MASDPLTTPANIIDIMYPVGCIHMTTSTDSPQSMLSRFGVASTWEKIEGRFLLGSSSNYTVNSTGGSSTHTLTVDELPSHTHDFKYTNYPNTGVEGWGGITHDGSRHGVATSRSGTTAATGSGQALNIMNPYYVVNIYRRTK